MNVKLITVYCLVIPFFYIEISKADMVKDTYKGYYSFPHSFQASVRHLPPPVTAQHILY